MYKFKTGKSYSASSVCDQNAVWTFQVISRTEKTVRLRRDDGSTMSRSIKITQDGEMCYPLGIYSMAPKLRASNEVIK